tara:strand:+ start:70501 stop:71322 length:822 start_codon:yes stop_codon:yes gene_type:complete
MDVLLGWSKERSKLIAAALHEWLPKILPSVKPWMSAMDINKGKDWFDELDNFLGEAKAVIVCLTPENVHSPWIYYECGHVAGSQKSNLICPYLLEDMSMSLSDGPLRRFQHTQAEKEDTFQLVKSLNDKLSTTLDSDILGENFEREWTGLQSTLNRIRNIILQKETETLQVKDESEQLAGGNLNDTERLLLLETGKDKHGSLTRYSDLGGGDYFQSNGKELNIENTPRSTARFQDALNRLVRLQLFSMENSKSFLLTNQGFKVFDKLNNESTN